MMSKALATGSNLLRRHVVRDGQCRRCCLEVETEKHIFFDCPYGQQIWRRSGISNNIINNLNATFEEKINACLQYSTSTRLTHYLNLPIWILWRIWKSRNLLIFQHRGIYWESIIQQAQQDAREWRKYGIEDTNINITNDRRRSTNIWKTPSQDWLKCNVDGTFSNQRNMSSAGWVIRDENGTFIGAGQALGNQAYNALESEMQALIMAMQYCWSHGYRKIQFESDYRKLIALLNNEDLHFAGYNWIRDINWWKQQFEATSFTWIGRDGNQVADCLAKQGLNNNNRLFVSHFYVPNFITHLLHHDHIRSQN
ncbi:uncharacterized protein LOC117129139 [Brassica rapa]|uniref:uncharacterized protein LOC117129139 n=1 Tax=Brassica campestris TaxID=3711 RepID=UPI00142D63B8|nr:uncharacterized protein LOC117129139 [Brassica rapa]